ncbi:septation protein A [Hahella sp. KA22]|uniref:septation protein A n=1 Tax=Hahella sp. KA22 TaxID=1628392 RepID=UPI000FDF2CFE|nr:septation protein A [Hahella sp. KA22]AZZ91530.1 septation protein A [Hahella sp. KA22]QAY54899.1 septation protein A [Hahella sp. KA22]
MKLLFDFFPIILFFVVYKATNDIVTATAALIPATAAQVAFSWFKYRKVEKMHLFALVIVVILGGATILFKDDTFIKWKPSVVCWLLAVVFLIGGWVSKKNLYQRMMEANISLPQHAWSKLNYSWVIFNALLGGLNLYVAYHYTQDQWVNFKLFGMLGLSLVFALMQGVYISRHMEEDEPAPSDSATGNGDNKSF